MLEMRPDCERCGRDLPTDQIGAVICSFECTFCATCNDSALNSLCPNCGGPLAVRPVRKADLLDRFPAFKTRKYKS